ncbi:hypothetical protein [Streptomyces sp. NPDC126499]|uniref:hypothetical protein n=1 Tax=Streptomyces sp. NPDC126499 TaxID=3155314 RepID=UPI00331E3FA8
MDQYLRCPMPQCPHRVGLPAQVLSIEAMTDHLIEKHGLPEASASYAASHLLPILAPRAA